jgi:leader peptidase (prepilin peptidase)/N-methyltransferase
MSWAWLIVILVPTGLVVGSFLNVLIHRVPRGQSVVRPRSRCPHCGTLIRWYENIPVLSYLVLGGRCSRCGQVISLRYPLVELTNALLWVLAAWRVGPSATLPILLPFLSAMLVLFFTDWDHQLLPDRITLPLALTGLVLAPWSTALFGYRSAVGWVRTALSALTGSATGPPGGMVLGAEHLAAALLGAVLGYAAFWVVGALWKALRGEEAIGGGDLKLMLGVGAFLGPGGVLLTVVIGSLAGSLVGVALMLRRRAGWRTRLPYGCFLTPAAVVAALAGRDLMTAYLRLAGWV